MTRGSADDITGALGELADAPPSTWEGRLQARFPDDPGLVVQALMWLHSNRERVVERGTPSLGTGDARYELDAVLDVGATASVWLARDRKLGRNVAIKLFRVEQSPALDQTLLEARAASEVLSDHVVRVLDVHDAEPPYLVMELVGEHAPGRGELVPGASASSCRPRDLDEAVRWIRDVARGVHDAHLRNVFHRDLKPHNMLITPISRRAKLTDFGLAVSRATAHTALMRAGKGGMARIAGTPAYIAPEQARGLRTTLDPEDADDRTVLVGLDIWGLGAIAFELLSGAPPWQPDGDLEPWEVAASATTVPDLACTPEGARVPRRLRRVVERALSLDPSARYTSAAELAEELDAVLAHRPTSFERARGVRLALWSRRNPQLALTALLAVALATLMFVATASAREARHQRNELATEMAAARVTNAELNQAISDGRRELSAMEATLEQKSQALGALETTVAEAKREYDAIVTAKSQELQNASAATRQLADSLTVVRRERDAARAAHKLYEAFWQRGRVDAERAVAEREDSERERDGARDERDRLRKERDDALAALALAQEERDAVRDECHRMAEPPAVPTPAAARDD
jgi:serine/threonine protein kinase